MKTLQSGQVVGFQVENGGMVGRVNIPSAGGNGKTPLEFDVDPADGACCVISGGYRTRVVDSGTAQVVLARGERVVVSNMEIPGIGQVVGVSHITPAGIPA